MLSHAERVDLLRPCAYAEGDAVRAWKVDGGVFRSYVFAHTTTEASSYLSANLVHWWYLEHGGEPATSEVHVMQNLEL